VLATRGPLTARQWLVEQAKQHSGIIRFLEHAYAHAKGTGDWQKGFLYALEKGHFKSGLIARDIVVEGAAAKLGWELGEYIAEPGQ
jgi:hypothetical protein